MEFDENEIHFTSQDIKPQVKSIFSRHYHSYDTGLATHLGVNTAIIYCQIQNISRIQEYVSIDDISCCLEYFNIKQIESSISILIKNGLLEKFKVKKGFVYVAK